MSHFSSKRGVFTGTLCGKRMPVAERNAHEAKCEVRQDQMRIMRAQDGRALDFDDAKPIVHSAPRPTLEDAEDAERDGMSSLYDCCPARPDQPHTDDCQAWATQVTQATYLMRGF